MTQPNIVYDGFFKIEERPIDSKGHTREIVHVNDSVHVLVHIIDTHEVVLVSQVREPMKSQSNPEGLSIEAIGGQIDDPSLEPIDVAVQEAFEEAGIVLCISDIQWVNSVPLSTSPGVSTEFTRLAYAAVFSEQVDYTSSVFGLSEDGEVVGRVIMSEEDFVNRKCEDLKLFTLQQWFKTNILKWEA